ncbi:MAG: NUDIX domain-containing protein [Candidatus Latescibacterota bacterium]
MSGRGFILGAACLLRTEAALVLEVQKPHKWVYGARDAVRIGVGCIGGGLRPGEHPVDALQRECVEEIGCGAHLRSARMTLDVGPDGTVVECPWTGEEAHPALLWEGTGPDSLPGGKVAVYLGEATGRPQPRDLPALLLVDASLLWALGDQTLSLGAALDAGAGLRTGRPLPPHGVLELVGTLAVLTRLRRTHAAFVDQVMDQVFATEAQGDGHQH